MSVSGRIGCDLILLWCTLAPIQVRDLVRNSHVIASLLPRARRGEQRGLPGSSKKFSQHYIYCMSENSSSLFGLYLVKSTIYVIPQLYWKYYHLRVRYIDNEVVTFQILSMCNFTIFVWNVLKLKVELLCDWNNLKKFVKSHGRG